MKTTFKKTLVAAALAAAAFNASAVTVASTAKLVSLEGNNGQDVALNNVVATLQAEYTVQDTISFTVSAGEWDTTVTPTLTAALLAGDAATIGFVGYSDDKKTVTFRITAHSDGAANGVVYTGGTFTLAGAEVKGTAAAATGDVKVSYAAKNATNTINIDNTGTTSATALTIVKEFPTAALTTVLDEKIDVTNGRKTFENEATTDTIVIDLGRGTVDTEAATYTGATVTLVAEQDWKFLDKDQDGTVETAELNGTDAGVSVAGATVSSRTLSADNKTITLELAPAAANTVADVTLTVKAPGNQTITSQTYSSVVTYKYSTSDSTPVAKTSASGTLDAGKWALNGSTVQVPYIVFGTVGGKKYNTIIQVNNASAVTGDVFVDVFKEDGTKVLTNKKVGSLAANSTTNIAGAIATELGDNVNGKFSVKVVSNVPAKSTSVYSAFVDGVSGERVIVNNDSMVQTK